MRRASVLARARIATARLLALICVLSWACGGDRSGTGRDPVRGTGQPRSTAGAGAPASAGEDGAAATAGSSAGAAGASAPITPAPNSAAGNLLDASCARASVQSSLLPTFMLLVLDRSGSMACNPPPTTDSVTCELAPERADAALLSKWEIVEQAIKTAVGNLPPDVGVGVSYFSNDNDCGVHADPDVAIAALAPAQRTAIDASLGNVVPGGGTPMVGATILAYRHMHEQALAGKLAGHRFVVLLTDGEQSDQCSDTTRCDGASACTQLLVSEEVPKAAGAGASIKTFVIGAPGSEPARSVLSEIALAGGTAAADCDVARGDCHFDMTQRADFAEALGDALAEIAGQALTCTLPLPQPTALEAELDLERVNVIHSPSGGAAPRVVPQDTTRGCDDGADGWQYADGNREIRLCGASCETVRADRGGRLDVVLGCPVQGPD
jgi:hypothetical protein